MLVLIPLRLVMPVPPVPKGHYRCRIFRQYQKTRTLRLRPPPDTHAWLAMADHERGDVARLYVEVEDGPAGKLLLCHADDLDESRRADCDPDLWQRTSRDSLAGRLDEGLLPCPNPVVRREALALGQTDELV
jgi:hypothetical protein